MERNIYSIQTQYPKPYLQYPSYTQYMNVIDRNMKQGPYYKFNKEDDLCIMYNYVQPVPPYVKPQCLINPQYEYWYTPQ